MHETIENILTLPMFNLVEHVMAIAVTQRVVQNKGLFCGDSFRSVERIISEKAKKSKNRRIKNGWVGGRRVTREQE